MATMQIAIYIYIHEDANPEIYEAVAGNQMLQSRVATCSVCSILTECLLECCLCIVKHM